MKLMGVLTPEQKEALEELRAERYRRWRERGAAHRPQEEHKPTKKEHRARQTRQEFRDSIYSPATAQEPGKRVR